MSARAWKPGYVTGLRDVHDRCASTSLGHADAVRRRGTAPASTPDGETSPAGRDGTGVAVPSRRNEGSLATGAATRLSPCRRCWSSCCVSTRSASRAASWSSLTCMNTKYAGQRRPLRSVDCCSEQLSAGASSQFPPNGRRACWSLSVVLAAVSLRPAGTDNARLCRESDSPECHCPLTVHRGRCQRVPLDPAPRPADRSGRARWHRRPVGRSAAWRSWKCRGPGSRMTRSGGVGEHRGEPLHPPVDSHVVDLDAALSQQLLNVPIREAVAQVPADRDRDHLRWEPEPRERRPVDRRTGCSRSTHPLSLLGQR
jgi:hypothetical protein